MSGGRYLSRGRRGRRGQDLGMPGGRAKNAGVVKKVSAHRIKILKSRDMKPVLHQSSVRLVGGGMRRIAIGCFALLALVGAGSQLALAQYSGGGQMPGGGRPGSMGGPGGSMSPGSPDMPAPAAEKPDAAAKKAFNAGMKSLNKARELEEIAAKATNPDKRAAALDKLGDAYNRALDQFTEALSNKGDMVDAWNYASYVHLRLGAYGEAIDDYNHTLALKPDLLEALEGRGEAYMGIDKLEEAKATYMNLVNHSPALAARLLQSMQKWEDSHRTAANGMRAADIDAFGKWLQERGG